MDVFMSQDLNRILYNKFVVLIGDSVQRTVYKDLVLLLQSNGYLSQKQLRGKGEFTHESDRLIEGGQMGEMTNGKQYREVRQYHTDSHLLRFYFVTRCYSEYFRTILADLKQEPRPDVVIMNSCVWDITRYGFKAVPEYRKNLELAISSLKEVLPPKCLFLWNMTLPVSSHVRGGFLTKEVEFMNDTLRLDVLEANFYAQQVVKRYGFDALDLHFHMRRQLYQRAQDGIHWNMTAHRKVSNMILCHIAEAWGIGLPRSPAFRFNRPDGKSNTAHIRSRSSHSRNFYGSRHRTLSSSGSYNYHRNNTPVQKQPTTNHQRSYSYDPMSANQRHGRPVRGQSNERNTKEEELMKAYMASACLLQRQCSDMQAYNHRYNTWQSNHNSLSSHRYQPYQSRSRSQAVGKRK